MTAPKKAGLAGLILPLLFGAGCVLAYWTYWNNVAQRIEAGARAALPSAQQTSVKVTGFPYRLTLEVSGLRVTNQSGYGFSADSLVATATPLNPRLWVLEGATQPQLALNNGPLRPLQAKNLQASLRFGENTLDRFSLTFDRIDALAATGGPVVWRTGKGQMHLVKDPKSPDVLASRFEVDDISLARALDGPAAILGQNVSRVMLAGPISQSGALLRSMNAWQGASGRLRIMAGEIVWGPVSLRNARGDLRLDGALKWQGQIEGQGALSPEGIAVAGLSAPVRIAIIDSKPALSGLPGINFGNDIGIGE